LARGRQFKVTDVKAEVCRALAVEEPLPLEVLVGAENLVAHVAVIQDEPTFREAFSQCHCRGDGDR
jgi:hypothetical protein